MRPFSDITNKTFWLILISLIVVRIIMVLLSMQDIPHTGVQEGGWWFEPGGDEVQYFNLAKSIAQLNLAKAKVTLGYPIYLAPFIYFTNAEDIKDILKPVLFIQAFILFSLSIVLVALIAKHLFQNLKIATLCAGIFTFYPYIFYLLFRRLGPYYPNMGLYRGEMAFPSLNWLQIISDPLSGFLVYLGFFLFFTELEKDKPRFSFLILLGILSGFSILVRVGNILVPTIFTFIWLVKKKFREAATISSFSFLTFSPQFIYNQVIFGHFLRFGYETLAPVKEGFYYKNLISMFSLKRWFLLFEKANFYIPLFIYLLPIFIIFLILGIQYLKEKNKINTLIILLWFFGYIIFYGSFIEGGVQPRFFIPAIPPFIIIFTSSFLWIYQNLKNKMFSK